MLWEVVIVIPKFQKRFPESAKSIEKAVSFTFLLFCIVKHPFTSFHSEG